MSETFSDIYCAEQINIPPMLPKILKNYCKAAIRTQPYDLLRWSVAYFKALYKNEELPVKERLEYPPYFNIVGITPGYLKIIMNAFKPEIFVQKEEIVKLWQGMSLNGEFLESLFSLGSFSEILDMQIFIAIAAGHLTHNLRDTMILLCELLTDDPEGGLAKIPFDTFCKLYTFLANLDGKSDGLLEASSRGTAWFPRTYIIWGIGPIVPKEQINAVIEHMKFWSDRQEEMVMAFNVRHYLCPPLSVTASEDN